MSVSKKLAGFPYELMVLISSSIRLIDKKSGLYPNFLTITEYGKAAGRTLPAPVVSTAST